MIGLNTQHEPPPKRSWSRNAIPIVCFDARTGKRLASFGSIAIAARLLGYLDTQIAPSLRRGYRVGPYRFRPLHGSPPPKARTRERPINFYPVDGPMRRFDSIKEAMSETGYSYPTVYKSAHGKLKLRGGARFELIPEEKRGRPRRQMHIEEVAACAAAVDAWFEAAKSRGAWEQPAPEVTHA